MIIKTNSANSELIQGHNTYVDVVLLFPASFQIIIGESKWIGSAFDGARTKNKSFHLRHCVTPPPAEDRRGARTHFDKLSVPLQPIGSVSHFNRRAQRPASIDSPVSHFNRKAKYLTSANGLSDRRFDGQAVRSGITPYRLFNISGFRTCSFSKPFNSQNLLLYVFFLHEHL